MVVDRSPQNRPLQLMVVVADPLLRLGLLTGLSRFSELQTVAEVETTATAFRLLAERMRSNAEIDLVLLGLQLNQESSELEFCLQLKNQYPQLPILLLGAPSAATLLTAFQMGVEGYCPQGSSISDLVTTIEQVVAGRSSWDAEILKRAVTLSSQRSALSVLRQNLRSSSLHQIDAALTHINAQLQLSRLSLLDQTFLTGRQRELKAARWLVKRLLATSQPDRVEALPEVRSLRSSPSAPSTAQLVSQPPELTAKDLQARLFDTISAKLQSGLENLTNSPLEIDILNDQRKRELLYVILRQIEASLDELRFSQLQVDQLAEKRLLILRDLWQAATADFFGRYYTLRVSDREIEVVSTLLQDAEGVETEILSRIPLVVDLYHYLLFQTPLTINNTTYAAETPEAIARATDLLENLAIQLANAVIQPLLNRFSDLEAVKQRFYDRRRLPTREIERFRNDLSWRYRVDRYFANPKAVFESQHQLFVLTTQGIAQVFIYAPRRQELQQLSGVQLAVTLALETRDAISPRLRSAIAFLGSGVVYVLTEVIGQAIGLIGRGIIKGIGNAWQDSKKREF